MYHIICLIQRSCWNHDTRSVLLSKGHAYIASVNHCIASRSCINHDTASVLSSKVNVQMVSHPFSCLRVMHKSSYYSSSHIHGSCWWHLQNHYTPFVHSRIMSKSLVHPRIMPKSVYHIGSGKGHAKSTAFHLLSHPRDIVPKSVCHFGFFSCLNCCTRLLRHFSCLKSFLTVGYKSHQHDLLQIAVFMWQLALHRNPIASALMALNHGMFTG